MQKVNSKSQYETNWTWKTKYAHQSDSHDNGNNWPKSGVKLNNLDEPATNKRRNRKKCVAAEETKKKKQKEWHGGKTTRSNTMITF